MGQHLRTALVKLAQERPDLRPHLLPLLTKQASSHLSLEDRVKVFVEDLAEALRAVWGGHKSKVLWEHAKTVPMKSWRIGVQLDQKSNVFERAVDITLVGTTLQFQVQSFLEAGAKLTVIASGSSSYALNPAQLAEVIDRKLGSAGITY